jgi:FixJ family two-component response regulator
VARKKQIAIVDDYASVRDAITSLLQSAGYAAEGFASAEEFLLLDNVEDFDCLVLDIGLPGMNGLELKRRLAATRCPPVVFVTGKEDRDGRWRASALTTEALAFLSKPFDAEELLHAVRCALSQRAVGFPRRA